MTRALELAEASAGLASPNPQVGCVLVRDGRQIGEGAHHWEARDHAEIVALKQAAALGHSARGATAYVTLEPCSHHGRTGPCADALIVAGITCCYVATVDPNPAVSGRGIAKLRAAGVEVHVGLEQSRARALNEAFAWSITRGRPFITLKSGLTTDGRLAPLERLPGQPHWLTGPESRADVQRMRHAADALLTGIGTVLADDPLLTDRSGLPRRRPLLRLVLDSHLRTPLDSRLVQSAQNNLWIVCSPGHDHNRATELTRRGARVLPLTLDALLQKLHEERILSLMVEAGPGLAGTLLQAGLVDRATLFYAPVELGPRSLPFTAAGPTSFALEQQMSSITKIASGQDVRVSGLLHDPWAAAPEIV